MLDLDREGTLPAWYSSLLWIFAAVLAVLNGAQSRATGRGSWHWWVLAALFVLLSLDEGAALHENIGTAISPAVPEFEGFFTWSWVYYGIALLIAAGLLFLKFLLTLPPRTFLTLGIGAVLFIAGALGAEIFGANIIAGNIQFPSFLNWTRLIIIEEFLEMLGTIVAIGALLFLLRDGRHVDVAIR